MRPRFEPEERRKLSLAEIGVGMSVCIAAICRDEKDKDGYRDARIVAVADRKVSHREYSNEDAAVKGIWLPQNWIALYAGNDVSPAIPITQAVSARMAGEPNTLENWTAAFEDCYKAHLSHLAASKHLGRWGLDMPTFLDKGREKFGDDVFDNLCAQIERMKLELTLMVIGFDGDDFPHIFTVSNPGITEIRDEPGYWAIGNGDYAAVNMLCFFAQNVSTSLLHTVYHCYVGKFMAESATDVGSKSWGWICSPESYEFVPLSLDEQLKKVFKKQFDRTVPAAAHTEIFKAFEQIEREQAERRKEKKKAAAKKKRSKTSDV